jgi:3-deoxy-D-manno-octulosonic-acid transferase
LIVNDLGLTFDKTKGLSLLLYHLFLLAYRAGIRLASPWNPKARAWLKGRQEFPPVSYQEKTIWMHCSSLGEFEQGRPVLEALRKQFPGYRCVLSFFSPSGYEVRKNYAGADQVIYLPIDSPGNARKLVDGINPALVIWVKYEYWYFYLNELHKRQVPALLVSGIFRPSQPFFKNYGALWRHMLSCFRHLFLQNEDSLELLDSISLADHASLAGDTRFDRVTDIASAFEPVPHIDEFVSGHRVIVAGSTWEEDEEELIHYVRKHPEIRFIIAPHEVDEERLTDIRKQFNDVLYYSGLSAGMIIPKNIHVLIIDNIGMLNRLYRYADITYVGGGFGDDGIHNVLEAAVFGKPVVFGPVYEKFQEARGLVAAGGAYSVKQALELETLLDSFWQDENRLKVSGEKAREYVYSNRGATEKILSYVKENRLLIN